MNVAEHLSNVTQEQEFLGALITFPEAARVAANIMEPAYFYEASHARIFEAIKARLTEGGTVTPTALASHLREEWNKPFLNDMTFGKYVSAMIANSAPAVSVASYAQDLKRLWALRSVYQAAVTPAGRDGELRAHVSEVFGAIDQIRAEMAETEAQREAAGISMEGLVDHIERVQAGEAQVEGCTTGLPEVDRKMLGYRPGELIIVGGRPGMGKTCWATSSLLKTAQAGHGCALFSLELPKEAVAARLLADHAFDARRRITFSDLRKCEMDNATVQRLKERAAEVHYMPLEVEYSTGLSVSEIGSRVGNVKRRMAKNGFNLGVVAIDYLKFVKASDRYKGQRVYEVGEITRGLKEIAKEHNVCVVLLAQLNRGVEADKDKRPSLQHLRESGDIEADADVVMFMYRDEYYIEQSPEYRSGHPDALDHYDRARNKLELIIAKNRNGPCCTVDLFCDIGCSAIRPLATGYGS